MSSKRKRRPSSKLDEDVLSRLMAGEIDPAELARDVGMSLRELIAWSARPDIATLLAGAIRLSDLRVQMLLCKFRTNAALHLIGIASQKEPSETSRKACVDLLRIELNILPAATKQGDAAEDASPTAPNESQILAALEQLGEQT